MHPWIAVLHMLHLLWIHACHALLHARNTTTTGLLQLGLHGTLLHYLLLSLHDKLRVVRHWTKILLANFRRPCLPLYLIKLIHRILPIL